MVNMKFLDSLSFWVSVVGIVIIIWGVIRAIFEFLHSEYLCLIKKKKTKPKQKSTRQKLGAYILLGLEFMIAGDIIHTVIKPSKDALIVLGAIVVIRTIISFFLNKELEKK